MIIYSLAKISIYYFLIHTFKRDFSHNKSTQKQSLCHQYFLFNVFTVFASFK